MRLHKGEVGGGPIIKTTWKISTWPYTAHHSTARDETAMHSYNSTSSHQYPQGRGTNSYRWRGWQWWVWWRLWQCRCGPPIRTAPASGFPARWRGWPLRRFPGRPPSVPPVAASAAGRPAWRPWCTRAAMGGNGRQSEQSCGSWRVTPSLLPSPIKAKQGTYFGFTFWTKLYGGGWWWGVSSDQQRPGRV